MYECECCERRIVPEKLKGIGYLCDDCYASYCWTGYEKGPAPVSHYPVCPFKETVMLQHLRENAEATLLCFRPEDLERLRRDNPDINPDRFVSVTVTVTPEC